MWNHRILRHEEEDKSEWFAIHEVFYNNEGIPHSCTENPISIIQPDIEGIKWEIDKLAIAIDKPFIEYSYFEELEAKLEDDNEND